MDERINVFKIARGSLVILCTLNSLLYLQPADVNDNVPFFTSSIYEASVTEGAESGALVLQVSATDLDLGLNGKVNHHRSPESVEVQSECSGSLKTWMPFHRTT